MLFPFPELQSFFKPLVRPMAGNASASQPFFRRCGHCGARGLAIGLRMLFTYHLKTAFALLVPTFLVTALWPKMLCANPLYGYLVLAGYDYSLPLDTAGDGGGYQQNLDVLMPLQSSYTLFSSPTFNMEQKASYTAIDLSNNTLYPIYADVGVRQMSGNGGQLHAWTIATTSIGDPNVNGSASLDTTLEWIDHFLFVGAPVGTPVQYEVTESFVGSLDASGGFIKGGGAYAQTNIQGYSLFIQEFAGQPFNIFNDSRTIMLTSEVGPIYELEQALVTGFGGNRSFSVEANVADTASVYIKVLTPGVSLVSASGYDYAAPAESVPEPSCLGLITCSLLGVALSRFRKTLTFIWQPDKTVVKSGLSSSSEDYLASGLILAKSGAPQRFV